MYRNGTPTKGCASLLHEFMWAASAPQHTSRCLKVTGLIAYLGKCTEKHNKCTPKITQLIFNQQFQNDNDMHKSERLNQVERDYYKRKHASRMATTRLLFRIAAIITLGIVISMMFSCNRNTYTDALVQHQPEPCDSLTNKTTGQTVYVYNCETLY